MSATASIQLAGIRLERIRADLTLVGVTEDERPLRGGAGRVDWRLCGLLSELAIEGHLNGVLGEAVLLPGTGRLSAGRVLVLGVGPRDRLTSERVEQVTRIAVARSLELGARRVALAALGWPHDEWPRHARPLMQGVALALADWDGPGSLQIRLAVAPEEAAPTARALAKAHLSIAQRGAPIALEVDPGIGAPSAPTPPRPLEPSPKAPGSARTPRGNKPAISRPNSPSSGRY